MVQPFRGVLSTAAAKLNQGVDAASQRVTKWFYPYPYRGPIQLYHRTATQAGDLAGTRILEVGCGHGGGASYLTRALGPASYVGLDLNPAGVDFCRRRHRVPGLEFVAGDAEDLPFPAESFDAVINVESSHCYAHFDRFLAEVARVLRPGGAFLYTDVRTTPACAAWEAALAGAPNLRTESWREINAEVLRGIELNSAVMGAVMDTVAPRLLRGLARKGAPVRESLIYRDLARGRYSYRIYHLTKV